jgi:hypothetical protein
MKYAAEMGSSAMIHKDLFSHSKGDGWEDTQIHRKHGDRISLI